MLQGFGTVSTLLKDLLYISYLVPSSRLRALVPSALPLRTAGGETFISLVVMRNTSVGPVWLPWPRQHYNQMNIRTYVDDPITGKHGVFFFKSGITSLSALVVPRMIGLPWEKIDLQIRTEADSFGAYRYRADGDFHGRIMIEVGHLVQQQGMESSASIRDAAVHITTPDMGFVETTARQQLLSFRVEHQFIEPVRCELLDFQFPLLERLGIIERGEMDKPHSVFLVPEAEFLVHLPPRRVGQTRETR
jgi:hypothetical protein